MTPPPAVQSVPFMDVIRHAVAPVLAGYALFIGILFVYRSERMTRHALHPHVEGRRSPPASAAPERGYFSLSFVRYLARTLVGGYASFLLVVMVFYLLIGERSRTLIRQALGQGSLLTFAVVLPGFLILSVVEMSVSRFLARRGRRSSSHPPSSG